MAVTATFAADFTAFETAVKRAVIEVRTLESGAETAEKRLSTIADGFSGRRLIQDATLTAEAVERIGGSSKLTEKELAQVSAQAKETASKLKALGEDVPPKIQALADAVKPVNAAHNELISTVKNVALGFAAMFSARAAFNFAADVIQDASELQNLSKQTRVSVEDLQVMAGAMSEFGVDAATLGKGLFELSKKVAGGDDSVASSLAVMGMSLNDVKGLEGEALFLTIERGLSKLQGSLRDETAAALFGSKMGMAMAGASEGIEGAMDTWRRLNHVASTESVQALDEYGSAIERAKKSLGAIAADMMGPVAQGFNVVTEAVSGGASKWAIAVAMAKDFAMSNSVTGASTSNLARVLDEHNQKLEVNARATRGAADAGREVTVTLTERERATRAMSILEENSAKALEGWQVSNLEHLKDIGKLTAQNAAAVGITASQFQKYQADQAKHTEELKKGEAEAQKFAAAMGELNSAGAGLSGTLEGVNGDVAESVKYYLQAGVSQSALATAYELTATQVKAVAAALDLERRAMEASAKVLAATIAEDKVALDHWNDAARIRIEQSGTTTDAQLADIERWRRDEVSKLDASGAQWQQHYDAIEAVAKAKIDGVIVNWEKLKEGSKASLEETAQKAANTYEYARAHSDQYTEAAIANLQRESEAAKKAVEDWATSAQGAGLTIIGGSSQMADQVTANHQRTADGARAAAAGAQGAWSSSFQTTADDMTRMTDGIITNATRIASEGGGLITNATKAMSDSIKGVGVSWSEAMMAVNRGEGTLTGTVQSGPKTDEKRAATQKAYDEGRYFGPVVGGSQLNPRGTGPDFTKLGYRALGGPVEAGQSYVVGERQPELFVPRQSGTIVPSVPRGGDINVSLTLSGHTFFRDRASMSEFIDVIKSQLVVDLSRQLKMQGA